MQIQATLEGLDSFLRKTSPALLRGPLRNFFNRVAVIVQGAGRERAPVDQGLLRNSIGFEVDTSDLPLWAKVRPSVQGYPAILEGSDRTHYRAGPLAGAPTAGWFAGGVTDSEEEIDDALGGLGDGIQSVWDGG
jgi:hypothetical protein